MPGMLWNGCVRLRALDAAATWKRGHVWLGPSIDAKYAADGSYDGKRVWPYSRGEHGCEAIVSYKDGYIYPGSKASEFHIDAVACYDDEHIWLGYNRLTPREAIATYSGSVGGAVTAVVLLYGLGEENIFSGYQADNAEKASNENEDNGGGEDAESAEENASPGDSQEAMPHFTFFENVFMILFVFLSLVPIALVVKFFEIYGGGIFLTSVSPREMTIRNDGAQPPPQPPPPNDWGHGINFLDSPASMGPISLSDNLELMQGEDALTPTLRQEATNRRGYLSNTSPNGQYQLVTICGPEDCGILYAVNFHERRVARVHLAIIAGSSHVLKVKKPVLKVAWSPNLQSAIFKLDSRFASLHLGDLQMKILDESELDWLFLKQKGGAETEFSQWGLVYYFNLNTLEWTTPNVFNIKAAVGRVVGSFRECGAKSEDLPEYLGTVTFTSNRSIATVTILESEYRQEDESAFADNPEARPTVHSGDARVCSSTEEDIPGIMPPIEGQFSELSPAAPLN